MNHTKTLTQKFPEYQKTLDAAAAEAVVQLTGRYGAEEPIPLAEAMRQYIDKIAQSTRTYNEDIKGHTEVGMTSARNYALTSLIRALSAVNGHVGPQVRVECLQYLRQHGSNMNVFPANQNGES